MKTDLVIASGMLGVIVEPPKGATEGDVWVKPFGRGYSSWFDKKNIVYVDVPVIEEKK